MTESKQDVLQFMTVVGKLKSLKRTGWVRSGVNNPEHVADHMYMMAVMTFFIQDDHNLNKARCLKLALVHDMAECIVGDITPYCGVNKDEKHAKEKEAMKQISLLAGNKVGQELFSLWEEYEAQETAEAKFVKNLDRFDMILQAHQYEQESGQSGHLQEFFNSTEGKFDNPMVKDWAAQLTQHRKSCEATQRTASDNECNKTGDDP
ncbi:HD domain-containing protein 2-like [Dendronephthya gigantea]|uniref:HD domain-containing protein 2-like n=1 Tax=Dendronephthya gigantea TaxID=151771 RepID=UPI00106D3393|nr:HD domain-containing protein 2-like [Dendronephthya gigantea]